MLEFLESSAGPSARKQQLIEASGEANNSSDDNMECENTKSPNKGQPNMQWQPVQPTPVAAGSSANQSDQTNKTPASFLGAPSFGIPPPPPPAAWPSPNVTAGDLDSDSLYSMLMSWYYL